jgi:hypothetical protein
MRSRLSIAATSIALAASALLAPSAATADTPYGNDELSGAWEIDRVPFTFEPALTGATRSEADPPVCWDGSTSWFSLTAPRDGVLRFDAHQSAYDGPRPAVAVFTGAPDDLRPAGCDAYDEDREYVSPEVEVPVTSGQRLHVALGSADSATAESPYVAFGVRYLTGKPRITLAAGRKGTVGARGAARVTGAIRCAEPSTATLRVQVRQGRGRTAVTATTRQTVPCTSTRAGWAVHVRSARPRLRPGKATVVVRAVATGELGRTAVRKARTVRLTRRAAAGGRLAFSRGNHVFTVNADGTRSRRLTATGKNYRPRWSPDGRRIAYVHETAAGTKDVWVMRADGTGKRRVTRSGTVSAAASWSPDGRWLVFGTPLQRVRSVPPFGDPEPLLGRFFEDGEPDTLDVDTHVAWSPDGRHIAYYSHSYPSSPDSYLLVHDLQTGLVGRVAEVGGSCCGGGFFADLGWGPDGAVLTFTEQWYDYGDPEADYATYVRMRPFSGGAAPTYRSVAEDAQGAVSRDGRAVAVVNGATGTAWTYVTAADGSGRRVLVRGYHPDWRP